MSLSVRATDRCVELTMHHLALDSNASHQDRHWRHVRFITFADVTAAQLEGGITDEECARFGRFVFGSVAALAHSCAKSEVT